MPRLALASPPLAASQPAHASIITTLNHADKAHQGSSDTSPKPHHR